MNRRHFTKDLCMSGLSLCTVPIFTWQCVQPEAFSGLKIIPANVSGTSSVLNRSDFRIAFGWGASQVSPGETMLLKVTEELKDADLYLRLTTAVEMRDVKLLHVYTLENDEYLGVMDIRYSSALVPYELRIDRKHISSINKFGVKIKLEGDSSFGFYNPKSDEIPRAFIPHFLMTSRKKGELRDFLDCFMSLNSIQTFGWREGAVLDGLWQLYDKKGEERAFQAIQDHFNLFFDDNGDLHYENGYNEPRDNRINGIESTLPYATLAKINPEHQMLKKAIIGLEGETKDNGMITGSMTLTAEGCYTVAYPLAVMGKMRNDSVLMQKAIEQLRHRFILIEDDSLYLRYHTETGNYTFRNWARGAAWILLGFIRTMIELKDVVQDEEVLSKFREGIDIAVSMQKENGLWNGFMDSNNAPDTSGSAGICAALLTGINNGLLEESYRPYAEKCWVALQNYITPDGFLKSVSQDNRGGTKLQESNYRVIAQMGMGLMAQFYAEL